MGVTGLLPFLKKVHEPVNVSKFAGCTVAIDAYCWLHKGAFSCAEKLALGEKTDQYVYYCMKFINNLLAKNIKPVMVFDGCHLPSKKNVEKSRREKRDMNRKKAAQFLREGRRAEARECLQRCIDISPEMALELMNVCRAKGVDCIVAPYEADAQLAYLNKIGVAQVIITEDSDLLLFGCEKVLFKMDHAGNGILIERTRLNEVMNLQGGHYTFDKFRYMCILSGCDYLSSLNGIGLAKANKVFKLARQPELRQLLKKLSTYLKCNITVPQEYIDGFIQANNTFLYQLVFDPLKRQLVPLTSYPPDIVREDVPYAGPHIKPDRAYQLALGNINIYTNDIFGDFNPDTYVPKYAKKKPEHLHLLSMWDRNYRVRPKAGLTEVQPSDRPVLRGKEVAIKSNFKKASPKKRIREADDGIDVKTNTELSSLYSHQSPCKKRLKHEDRNEELQRFMFSDDDKLPCAPEDIVDEAEDNKPVEDAPEFFNSLSDAHPETGDEPTEVDEENKENGLKSPTRNVFAFKSPSKKHRFNLNATKPGEVKSRFFSKPVKQLKLLNSLKNIPRVEKTETITNEESLSGYKLVHENTANVNSTESSHTTKSNNQIQHEECQPKIRAERENILVKSKSVLHKSKSSETKPYIQSPTSAFNWSKFKFASKDGAVNDQNKSEPTNTVSSPHPLNRFKFKSDTELRKSFSSVDKVRLSSDNLSAICEKRNSHQDTLSADCDGNDNQDIEIQNDVTNLDSVKLSLGESESYPYSIDSYCLSNASETSDTQSQEACDSQGSVDFTCGSRNTNSQSTNSQESVQSSDLKLPKKKGLSIYFKSAPSDASKPTMDINEENRKDEDKSAVKVNIGDNDVVLITSDDEDLTSPVSNKVTKSIPLPRKSPKQNAVKTKGGCRVSGLSRKTKTTKVEDSGKQQSLKDMFSKFAHSKSSKPKLHHGNEVGCTPESDESLMNKASRIQRHLQL